MEDANFKNFKRGSWGEILNVPVMVPTPERATIESEWNRSHTQCHWFRAVNFDVYGFDLTYEPYRFATIQKRVTEQNGRRLSKTHKTYYLVRWFADSCLPPRFWEIPYSVARRGVEAVFTYRQTQRRRERYLRYGESLRLRVIRQRGKELQAMIPGARRIAERVILPNGEVVSRLIADMKQVELKSRFIRK
jgi:hypothetical protein